LLALNPKNLDAGADADACGESSGMNVLHHAISQGDQKLVWRLLEMRPDLQTFQEWVHSAVHGDAF